MLLRSHDLRMKAGLFISTPTKTRLSQQQISCIKKDNGNLMINELELEFHLTLPEIAKGFHAMQNSKAPCPNSYPVE